MTRRQLAMIVKLNDDYSNILVGNAKRLFRIANNPDERELQLSPQGLEVWELFNGTPEDSSKFNSIYFCAKYISIYFRAKYVNANSIEVFGNPIKGNLSRESLNAIGVEEKDIKDLIGLTKPIRIIKLLEDNYETI